MLLFWEQGYFKTSIDSKTTDQKSITLKEQLLLSASGTRGALAIALAFMLPETLDYWWTIHSIVFGVVLFSTFVQAPLAAYWQKTRLNDLFKEDKHENQ